MEEDAFVESFEPIPADASIKFTLDIGRQGRQEEIISCIADYCGYDFDDWDDLEPSEQHRSISEQYENWMNNYLDGSWFVIED